MAYDFDPNDPEEGNSLSDFEEAIDGEIDGEEPDQDADDGDDAGGDED